ncbi:hypothetical protein EMIT036CA2_30553 [Chryseobacterium sp. IT-36CA2]
MIISLLVEVKSLYKMNLIYESSNFSTVKLYIYHFFLINNVYYTYTTLA